MPSRKSVTTAIILLALAGSGCANRTYRQDQTPPPIESGTVYQTQVSIGGCVFGKERAEGGNNSGSDRRCPVVERREHRRKLPRQGYRGGS